MVVIRATAMLIATVEGRQKEKFIISGSSTFQNLSSQHLQQVLSCL
jgi:hypothetical protein